jgi:glycosyltransferase involved in cell wall biosynthesis
LAFGRPTLALRGGGYLDTVTDGVSGLFFDRAEGDAVREAVRRSRAREWDVEAIREHGHAFDEARFHATIVAVAERAVSA